MHWNYRVISRVDGAGTEFEETNLYISEVYYHDTGELIGWVEDKGVAGESIEELRQTLAWMTEALDKPILNETELRNQATEARENGDEDIFPEDRLSLDEVLDSLGLEREDVDSDVPKWDGPDSA